MKDQPLGYTRWAVAEGYIPQSSTGPEPEMTSHDTACILNTSEQEAHVTITIYFSDREPVGPYLITVPARRTLHQRFNTLDTPMPIPRGTDYSCVIESDIPVVVQYSRLDSRQPAHALLSVIPYHE